MKLYRRPDDFNESLAAMYYHPEKANDASVASRCITFQVTDACNLRCSYCYQTNKGTRVMPVETAKALIDLILSGEKGFREYLSSEFTTGINLDFIGGEPLLALEVIDQAIDYFHSQTLKQKHPWKNKWRASITTNGTIYTDEVKRFLTKHENHLSYSVTVDGSKQLHDACRKFPDGSPSYDLAMATVRDRRKQGYYVGNKLTISPENLPYLYEAIVTMAENGYQDINANCVFENVWKQEDAALFYQQLKKLADYLLEGERFRHMDCSLFNCSFFVPHTVSDNKNYCGGTGLMLAMDPDGWLYPCLRYMESSIGTEYPAYRIGNLWEGIGQSEEYQKRIDEIKHINRRTQSTDACFYCPIGFGCAWCSAYNYQCFGTANQRATYICEMHKARALANVYYWNKLFQLESPNTHLTLWVPREWALAILKETEYEQLLELSASKPMTVEEAYQKAKVFVDSGRWYDYGYQV